MEAGILLALQGARVDGLVQLAALISACGNMAFAWIVLALVLAIFPGKRKTAVLIFVAIAVVFVVSELILEPLVARTRPCDAGIGVTAVMGVSHNGFSFPSGHSVSSFAAATVCALTLGRKWAVPTYAAATIMAITRLYLGVHYPTDVLAGALIGVLIGLGVVWVYNNFIGYRIGGREPAGSPRQR